MRCRSKKLTLQLTGDRRPRRLEVRLRGRSVWLTATEFDVFIELLLAALTGVRYSRLPTAANGDPEHARVLIKRLRDEIDGALGKGSGKRVVQTGFGTEYRLAVPRSRISATSDFFSLPASVVPSETMELLRSLLRPRSVIGL